MGKVHRRSVPTSAGQNWQTRVFPTIFPAARKNSPPFQNPQRQHGVEKHPMQQCAGLGEGACARR